MSRRSPWLAWTVWLVAVPAWAGAPVTLAELEMLTPAADYGAPVWSADGEMLAFTGADTRGLYLVPAAGGVVREVPGTASRACFRPRWSEDATRLVCPARGAHAAFAVVPDSGASEPIVETTRVTVVRDDLALYEGGDTVLLTHGEDRFFDPRLSPDGHHVAFVGLTTGIHVMTVATRDVAHLGAGTRPTWTPDSRVVIFERTVDDGERLVSSELYAWGVGDEQAVALTTTPDRAERHPAVSTDGQWLAVSVDGAIAIGRLNGEGP